ncbi:MAG TPA: VOC family protein [Xanthomonadaceae bacterium]|nr:VOC family protein [Xanthomonadaceae bacterium]
MKTTPYLNFNGDCRQAFETYERVLGGELYLITYGEAPADAAPGEGCGDIAASAKDRIMHVTLARDRMPVLMGSDMPPGMEKSNAGGIAVALNCDDNGEAERVFAALAEGGQVQMAMAETFWAERFGMLTDRFGTPWLINGVYKQT